MAHNYNYDPTMKEEEHQETLNAEYKKFKRLFAVQELMQRHADLKCDVDLVYSLAEDYNGHNFTDELETELMKMEG